MTNQEYNVANEVLISLDVYEYENQIGKRWMIFV
jgi:hypothetical protein